MKEEKIFLPLTSKNICEIYNILCAAGLVTFPIPFDAEQKIQAIVANINGYSLGVPHYFSIEEKVFAYFYFIIKDHPFVDGNKRTATLVFLVLASMNKLQIVLPDYDLDALALYIEDRKPQDHHEFIYSISQLILLPKAS